MERFLNDTYRSFDIQHEPIGMQCSHGQPIGFREIHQCLIFRLVRPEFFRELLRRQVLAKGGAARVVKILQQLIQSRFLSQWQTDGELQVFARGKAIDRCHSRGSRGPDARFNRLRRCLG